MPPARPRVPNAILVLDCRFILQGFRWQVVVGNEISVQSLVDLFSAACPAGFIVSITGAPVQRRPNGAAFLLQDGTLLTVAFVENLLQSDDEGSPPPDDFEFLGPDGDTPPPRPHASEHPHTEGRSEGRNEGQDRSRSPHRGTTTPGSDLHMLRSAALSPSTTIIDFVAIVRRFAAENSNDMWQNAFQHDALAESMRLVTPVGVPGNQTAVTAFVAALFGAARFGYSNALFAFHAAGVRADEFADLAISSAEGQSRITTSLASTEAPSIVSALTSDEVGTPPCAIREPDEISQATVSVDAHFCILVPEYQPEHVALCIEVPQPEPQAIQSLQEARDPHRCELFPDLVPVQPQPGVRWCTFLALPAWVRDTVIVCFDAYALDGRIFACRVPGLVDVSFLLEIAGFRPSSEVNVLHPRTRLPLAQGVEVALSTGDCVTFWPRRRYHEPLISFRDMLGTHLPWASDAPFPYPREDARTCLVADHAYADFELVPARATRYREDIASRLHFNTHRLCLQAADPHPPDVALDGRPCRSVVSVSESYRRSSDVDSTGLLDCRPLLAGWKRLETSAGWVSLAPLRRSLVESAPLGWHVAFQGCPHYWNWLWIKPGQVVVAVFQPSQMPTALPSPAPGLTTTAEPSDEEGRNGFDATEHTDDTATQQPSHRVTGKSKPNHYPSGRALCGFQACLVVGLCFAVCQHLCNGSPVAISAISVCCLRLTNARVVLPFYIGVLRSVELMPCNLEKSRRTTANCQEPLTSCFQVASPIVPCPLLPERRGCLSFTRVSPYCLRHLPYMLIPQQSSLTSRFTLYSI